MQNKHKERNYLKCIIRMTTFEIINKIAIKKVLDIVLKRKMCTKFASLKKIVSEYKLSNLSYM